MLDELLAVGSCFDWISPLYAFGRDALDGGGHTFFVDRASWSGVEVERVLRRGGVKTWGLMVTIDGQAIMVSVPKAAAARATAILEGAGVVVLQGAVQGGDQGQRRRGSPRAGGGPRAVRGRSKLWALIER